MALLPQHAQMLADSGLSREIIEARGYKSVTVKAELKRLGFADSQCLVPTLLIPIWNAQGERALYHHRPDQPRIRDGKSAKYEFPARSHMAIDVPPAARDRIRRPDVPLVFTEGVKKADAAVSHGLCCLALVGVWNWRGVNEHGGKTTLPELDEIAWKDQGGVPRVVYLAFDSDAMFKKAVYLALARFAAVLKTRGADVRFIYLPNGVDGRKVGLDDYLAAGHSVDDLLRLASPDLKNLPLGEKVPYRATPSGLLWDREGQSRLTSTPLTNFTARITAEVIQDDGVETRRFFEIEAVLKGRTIPFPVPASSFAGMNWITEHLGASAYALPGIGLRDHVRVAIQMLSGEIPERSVFAHTGWRQIGDEWVYLHAGGAIGNRAGSQVAVRLPLSLENFALPEPETGPALVEGICASLRLLDLAPDVLTFPLLCGVYRVPLGPLDHSIHLSGPSGAFKSEAAALAQQHFGKGLDARHLPGSWTSTDNALEGLAFTLKDALCVIDDFAPTGTQSDVQRLQAKADRVLRGQGNNAGRGRMNADATIKRAKPPRGLILSTGEDVPNGHSLRARTLVLEVSPGDITPQRLTDCQKDAAAGLYSQSMAGFLAWLALQYSEILRTLREKVQAERDPTAAGGQHRRTPEITANLLVGLRHFLDFALYAGAITEAEYQALWCRGRTALAAVAEAQSQHQSASEPTQRYLELLSSGLASGKAHVAGMDGGIPEDPERWGWREETVGTGGFQETRWRPQGDRVGWSDGADLFLQPDAAFNLVRRLGADSGDGIVLHQKTLHKRLWERGILVSTEASKGTLTIRKTIGGVRHSVLHLRSDSLFLPKPDQSAQSPRKGGAAAELRSNPDASGESFGGDFSEVSRETAQQNCPVLPPPHQSGYGAGPDGQIGQFSTSKEVLDADPAREVTNAELRVYRKKMYAPDEDGTFPFETGRDNASRVHAATGDQDGAIKAHIQWRRREYHGG